MKRKLSVLIVLVMILTSISAVSYAAEGRDIVILFTNDTHCEVDGDLGFADVSALQAIELEKGNEVIIVDSGDAVQGGAIGTLSNGEYIIEIMNAVGYDVSAIGNHEFDYGIQQLMKLSELAEFPYVCSNFIETENGTAVFEAYEMITADDVDIAFIGVTTPNALTSTSPDTYKNDDGEFIYDFSNESLAEVVQKSINDARDDGAEYVIGLMHMGVDTADEPYTSQTLIQNTEGFDLVLDAHSHTVIKEGKLISTGSKFEHIGCVRISDKGEITAELIDDEYKASALSASAQSAYDKTEAVIKGIEAEYTQTLSQKLAFSEYDLTINDPALYTVENGEVRRVRSGETNLGDFCADAYRYTLGTDIAVINGGGVRADLKKGDVTYGDILDVNPFGNDLCVIKVKGSQVLDALEHGARSYPKEEGAFLQVSGLTYEIDTDVTSPVVLDETGMFKETAGERRVKNVKVNGKPIDENAIYTMGGASFTLIEGGDGFSMFSGAEVVNSAVCTDLDALTAYVSEELGGIIGEKYANPHGEGRIAEYTEAVNVNTIPFTDVTEADWYYSSVAAAYEKNLVNGVSETAFAPNGEITRAMFVTILHRLCGLPDAASSYAYTDVDYNEYYGGAVAWATLNNVMIGLGDETFAPDKPITREEMSTAIMRFCIYMEKGPAGAWAIKLDYKDLNDASEWALESMMFNKINNIMTGDGQSLFNPANTATRAEAAEAILRTADYIYSAN